MVEFALLGIPCQQQQRFDIRYKNTKVGDYVPDLIVHEQIVVETKVVEKITDLEVGWMLNYLKISGLKLGYMLNFKSAKLEWRRIVR